VLPYARSEEARSVADRITAVVAETGFEGDALEPVTTCATVAASAAYPDDAAGHAALLGLVRSRLSGDPVNPEADPS
jgi:hypothetical protein